MTNKKGFTLIELLVLIIIGSGSGCFSTAEALKIMTETLNSISCNDLNVVIVKFKK